MEKLDISTRQNLVNDFADYVCEIISENDTHKTKLSVVDVENFMIVKGFTKSENVINFSEINSNFIELNKNKYPNLDKFKLLL